MKCTEFNDDVNGFEINFLDENQGFYQGADTIWMSRFLDSFSKDEILSILKRAVKVMDGSARLFMLETFWGRRSFEAGSSCA